MKKQFLLGISLMVSALAQSQDKPARPKLVVGIVVDQMRYDYLYRFASKFGNDGFKKLMNEGFFCRNTHYNYVPTYTGPGHASIYTGTTPSIHGIVANDWYDRSTSDTIYCVEDKKSESVGAPASGAGKMSPRNLLSTTITDELKLATNGRSKVIGISLKDRGAILPAGHMANASYWFDSGTGSWISSTYYMKELPAWVKSFNDRKHSDDIVKQSWTMSLPAGQYTESTADDMPYEGSFFGGSHTFPYDLSKLKGNSYEIIRYTPFGNTLTKDLAKEAVKGEQLGKGSETDFLALSFSATDYVGHQFGPNSVEIEDTYIRLDKDIADLLKFLEESAGKGNMLVFLTADHGVAHVPDFLKMNNIPAGVLDSKLMMDSLNKYLIGIYGKSPMSCYMNQQIYLNYAFLDQKGISSKEVQERIAAFLPRIKGVSKVVTSIYMENQVSGADAPGMVARGFNSRRSGDIAIILEPGWFEGKKTGSTHGQSYAYDTHVPLLWYGWKIQRGYSVDPVNITDIAPTLAQLLDIEAPNGTTGAPIPQVCR